MKNTILATFLTLTFILSACSPSSSSGSSSNLPSTSPSSSTQTNSGGNNLKVSSADLKKVSEVGLSGANNKFALKMLNSLLKQEKNKNVFFSPLSISTALAMTYNGANGKTKEDMGKTLEINDIKISDLNNAYKTMKSYIESKDSDVTLSTANSLWLRKGEQLNKDFTKTIDTFFDGKVTELDFSDKDASKTINDWVSDKTNGKIKDLIKNIDPATFLYLINAIYFKGSWENKFDSAESRDNPFMNSEGVEKDIKTMFKRGDFEYYKGDDFEAVRLYYGKEKKAFMNIFLPSKSSNLNDFYKKLDNKLLDEVNAGLFNAKVNFGLPKFKMEYEKKLNDSLMDLGMSSAFGSGADFSKLASGGGYISEVKHKSFVEVNEEGTEAAAATSVAITKNALIYNRFIVDRPFFFTITETNSNMILFMGSVSELT